MSWKSIFLLFSLQEKLKEDIFSYLPGKCKANDLKPSYKILTMNTKIEKLNKHLDYISFQNFITYKKNISNLCLTSSKSLLAIIKICPSICKEYIFHISKKIKYIFVCVENIQRNC